MDRREELWQDFRDKYYSETERRLKEAIAQFKDLAVSEPEYVDGDMVWEYRMIEPGMRPWPPGKKWTIYQCGG